MSESQHVKTIQGLKYFTGAHPELRSLIKKDSRPSEFGHKVWSVSLVLIEFLAAKSLGLENKAVIEIGCGWGILGLYLSKSLKCKVTCTDLDSKVLPIVSAHAKLNSLEIKTKAQSFAQISDQDLINNDVLVGVEVCYSDEAAVELNQLIDRAYSFGVDQILIADPGRPGFLEIICKNKSKYKKEVLELPGTKNGKVTHLLHLKI